MDLLRDIFLALRVAVFAAMVPLVVRLPIRKLESRLDPSVSPPFDPVEMHRILRVAQGVFRHILPAVSRPCLIRGVTLFYFLRRAGMNVSLVFGIGKVKGQSYGHCWLARQGAPFLESHDPLEYFLPMYAFHPGKPQRAGGDHSPGSFEHS